MKKWQIEMIMHERDNHEPFASAEALGSFLSNLLMECGLIRALSVVCNEIEEQVQA